MPFLLLLAVVAGAVALSPSRRGQAAAPPAARVAPMPAPAPRRSPYGPRDTAPVPPAPAKGAERLATGSWGAAGEGERQAYEASARFDSPGSLPELRAPERALATAEPEPETGPAATVETRGTEPVLSATWRQPPGPEDAGTTLRPPEGYEGALAMIERRRASKGTPSRSIGSPSRGSLRDPMELPLAGYGYLSVRAERRRNYGADALVLGLMRLAADFQKAHPGHPGLRLGDLSASHGGEVSHHASHENGRDADVLFLATGPDGAPVDHREFLSFDSRGRRGPLRFDVARNWALVVLMLENPYWEDSLQNIFVAQAQRAALLEHARGLARGAGPAEAARLRDLLRRAERVLSVDSHHADHFHIRIVPARPEPQPSAVA